MTDRRIVPLHVDLVCYGEPTLVENHERNPPKRLRLDESDEGCDELLNCILPPRRWKDGDGTRWMQRASNRSANRADVAALTETFEKNVRLCRARDTGVCPTRRALYSQCFDEILRQVTVNCAERGLLLLKIRDEFKMTEDACRTLYASNVKCFGSARPALSAAAEPAVRREIVRLEAENRKLERDVAASVARYETVLSRENERRAARQRRHDEMTGFLKAANRQLKMFLDGITTVK